MRHTRSYSGQHLVQGMVHLGLLFRAERIHGAHQNFERIARKQFVTFVRQPQTDASPVRLGSLSDQIPACLKCLDRLRSGATGGGLKLRKCRRGPGERIQEYILRSWSLVKMGTTANQKKLFFNLRKAKSRISALEEADLRPDQVKLIAKRLGVTEQDVVDMNRRLGGDVSLNSPIREEGDSGEWQDWLVDESPDQETTLAASEEFDDRRKMLSNALTVLNERERRIFEARRLTEEQITIAVLAEEFGVSRERVRQIEVRAFEKVQNAVKHRVAGAPAPL